MFARFMAWVLVLPLVGGSGCAYNPATGRLQLSLLDEREEVGLGRSMHGELVQAVGIYPDEALQRYVGAVGQRLAARSERSRLQWNFTVVDDPAVNAFALPGGFVYVARGLLAHFESEAELAAVLGHEIGHVTARHGVNQYSRARLAQRGLGIVRVVDPGMRHVGAFAAGTAELALLRHSRDDEIEADRLGVRYLDTAGYPPGAMLEVLEVLAEVQRQRAGQVPTWLSTHPRPEQRLAELPLPGARRSQAADVATGRYMRHLDGLVFGQDPRHGFLTGTRFVHPAQEYRIDVPDRWTASHDGGSLVAASPDEQALVLVAESEAETAAAAMQQLFAVEDIRRGERWRGTVGGYPARSSGFWTTVGRDAVAGLAVFVDFEDGVIAMLGLAPASLWDRHFDTVSRSFASFRRLRDAELRNVRPARIEVVRLQQTTSLSALHRKAPSTVPIETLALINRVAAHEELPAGRWVKRVTGGVVGASAPP